ncbi:PTS fructose-like transporter subunit IIB [Streptobacillus ratti]|uniref:PTS fructose-like transporter subunit IIB n=1 Tax=Streptobacillus ratti TaxID=1720557 RepID=UPI0009341E9C|nr:PTS fructose-like transporter subunit IIB [Streptobacillus ratti]
MKILAVTACPSGVAHTYMAAESLKKAAQAKGYEVKVETQGQIGIENEITIDEIKDADVVILTTDIGLKNIEKFNGKPIVKVPISDLVKKAGILIDKIEEAIKNRNK